MFSVSDIEESSFLKIISYPLINYYFNLMYGAILVHPHGYNKYIRNLFALKVMNSP